MDKTSSEGKKTNKSKGLTFAEKELARHGWEKGKGLGKRENGISKAIKVKVKCDTAGVGHNSAEQFTFHWWDHLFNSSAANLAVEAGKDGVQVRKVSQQEDGAVTNKKPSKSHKERNMLYGRFVKAATLKPGGEESVDPVLSSDGSDGEEEKLDLSTARRLTDEELVQACGRRTAHKGARHGLTMSAKLARLEEQEKAFLASHPLQKVKVAGSKPALQGSRGDSPPRKRKAAKKPKERHTDPVGGKTSEATGEVEEERKKKKKKKRRKEKEEDDHDDGAGGKGTEMSSPKQKAKWKR